MNIRGEIIFFIIIISACSLSPCYAIHVWLFLISYIEIIYIYIFLNFSESDGEDEVKKNKNGLNKHRGSCASTLELTNDDREGNAQMHDGEDNDAFNNSHLEIPKPKKSYAGHLYDNTSNL